MEGHLILCLSVPEGQVAKDLDHGGLEAKKGTPQILCEGFPGLEGDGFELAGFLQEIYSPQNAWEQWLSCFSEEKKKNEEGSTNDCLGQSKAEKGRGQGVVVGFRHLRK